MYRLIQIHALNRPGVLHRITQIVFKRHYNIDNLTLVVTENPQASLINIGIHFPEEDFEKEANLLAKQMEKQVDIVSAHVITSDTSL